MNTIFKQAQSNQRQERIEAGFFDGRFRNKVIKDKKKEANKKACRNFKF